MKHIEKDKVKIILPKNLTENQNDYKYMFLNILGTVLQSKGISVTFIQSYQDTRIKEIILNFIINNIISLKKYSISINFDQNEIRNIISNKNNEQKAFRDNLKSLLSKKLKIKEEEIIITNYRGGINPKNPKDDKEKLKFDIIFYKDQDFIELDINKQNLIDSLKSIKYEPSIINKISIIENMMISLDLFDDFDYKYNKDYSGNRKNQWKTIRRWKYKSPENGWKGIGLNIRKYGRDLKWITGDRNTEQWPVAYHGISGPNGIQKLLSILKNGLQPGKRQKYASQVDNVGVYFSPDIDECFKYAKSSDLPFAPVLKCRVNPENIGMVEKSGPDYWVITGSDSFIRPYKLLIKNK